MTPAPDAARTAGGGSAGTADDIALLDLAAIVLQRRRAIFAAALAVGVLFVLAASFATRQYTSSASFVPNGADDSRSSLGGIAAQLGVTIPTTANAAQSPAFYAELIRSRALLTPIADDTFVVPELGGRRVTLLELFDLRRGTPERLRDLAIARLAKEVVGSGASRETGVVSVSATTPFSSVSYAITQRLVTGVNGFNLRTRQSQAASERRFIEERLRQTRDSLRSAEDRAEAFLRTNREYRNSPQLLFAYDRLQRDVALQQQVYTTLSQSYENARIREVRDTPVITVVDSARVPTTPNRLRRVAKGILGMVVGGIFAIAFVLASGLLARRRAAGDPDAERFAALLADAWHDVARLLPRRLRRHGAVSREAAAPHPTDTELR